MTDSPPESRPSRLSNLSADLKAAAGAIGWLAGSMSGVVALMAAVGFLAAKSHLNMLGIELYSGVAAGAYVEIGAKFFYITFIMLFESLIRLARTLVPALAILMVPVLAALAAAAAVLARVRRIPVREVLAGWRARLPNRERRKPPARIILCSLLALVLFWAGSQYRHVFAPVRVSGVLHTACDGSRPGAEGSPSLEALSCAIRNGELARTQGYYAGLVNLVFALFLVVVPFRARLLREGATRILYLPLAAMFMIYSLVLPLSYGALVMPNDFPLVNLHARKSAEIRIPEGPFFLIHQGERSLVLWHGANAASYVIPSSEITTLEVTDRASLFSAPPPKPVPPGGRP